MREFPTCLFGFLTRDPTIERRTLSGGVSLSGVEDVVQTDFGGYVQFVMGDANLLRREQVLAFRALATELSGGMVEVVVPLCDARHQPTFGRKRVSHSDGTPFSDDTEYSQWGDSVAAASSAAVGSTQLSITIGALDKPLLGGEWFSIDHPAIGHRAYNVYSVNDGVIKFLPPLRADVSANEKLNFGNPKCVMRVLGDMRAPVNMGSGYATYSVTFIEAPIRETE